MSAAEMRCIKADTCSSLIGSKNGGGGGGGGVGVVYQAVLGSELLVLHRNS